MTAWLFAPRDSEVVLLLVRDPLEACGYLLQACLQYQLGTVWASLCYYTRKLAADGILID